MHNAAFRSLGLPYVYVALPVENARVKQAVAGVRALGLAGVNVTVPHKEAVLPHLDRLSARARACGAVNTIVNRRGVLRGENTDVIGLQRDWKEKGVPSRIDTALVLGAGGSARAVVVALGSSCKRILIAARRPARARKLARTLAGAVRARLEPIDLARLRRGRPGADKLLGEVGLVVNATSLGMKGEAFFPMDFEATPSICFFYDLIYVSERTPFLEDAHRAGRRGANGLGMLLHQGAAAFELWTGVSPPIDVMRRALRRAS